MWLAQGQRSEAAGEARTMNVLCSLFHNESSIKQDFFFAFLPVSQGKYKFRLVTILRSFDKKNILTFLGY